jgi:hypothetical protein
MPCLDCPEAFYNGVEGGMNTGNFENNNGQRSGERNCEIISKSRRSQKE